MHSDLAAAARAGLFASSSPPLRSRFVSAPVVPLEGAAEVATTPSRFSRYGTGGSLWYSQSQKRRRGAAHGESEELERAAAQERERAALASPEPRVEELTTRLARVLQNKSLMASLGPMQGYLGGDEASVSRADGGADNDRQMLDHAEKPRTTGCITC